MTKTSLTFLSGSTKQAVEEITEELGLKDPSVFVRKAVEDKLLEMKRGTFFEITDRVSKGLRRHGIRPVDLLNSFKS